MFHDLFYDGCFGDYSYFEDGPNIYSDVFSFYVYTSTFHMVDKDFNDIEGFGVKPDIEVLYSARLLESGVDNQLERALVYLRTGR